MKIEKFIHCFVIINDENDTTSDFFYGQYGVSHFNFRRLHINLNIRIFTLTSRKIQTSADIILILSLGKKNILIRSLSILYYLNTPSSLKCKKQKKCTHIKKVDWPHLSHYKKWYFSNFTLSWSSKDINDKVSLMRVNLKL